ncbi:hypothetical protein RI367_007860 [Sorochytrium milnesiophthora]
MSAAEPTIDTGGEVETDEVQLRSVKRLVAAFEETAIATKTVRLATDVILTSTIRVNSVSDRRRQPIPFGSPVSASSPATTIVPSPTTAAPLSPDKAGASSPVSPVDTSAAVVEPHAKERPSSIAFSADSLSTVHTSTSTLAGEAAGTLSITVAETASTGSGNTNSLDSGSTEQSQTSASSGAATTSALNRPEPQFLTISPAGSLPRPTSPALSVSPRSDLFDKRDNDDSIQFCTLAGKHIFPMVRCATLVKIVERLTVFPIPDIEFTTAMLLTHQSFTTSEELLELLIQRYFKLHPLHPQTDIRPRVCNILKLWVTNFWRDFESSPTLKETLRNFIQETVVSQDKLVIGEQMCRLMSEKEEEHTSFLCKRQQIHVDVFDTNYPSLLKMKDFGLEFLRHDPWALAENITLLNGKLFAAIPRHEFLDQRWTKPHQMHLAPNIIRKIQFFNRLSHLVVSMIVSFADPKTRLQVLKRCIKLGACLRKMNNFDLAFAVVSGLSTAPITRLKRTWGDLASKHLSRFNDLSTELSPVHNFKQYRAVLTASATPVTPYLGVFLSDLTFIGDGNPDLIDGRLINVEKRTMLAAVVHEIQRFQLAHYSFTGDVILQTWIMEAMDKARSEQENYALSLEIEPRKS